MAAWRQALALVIEDGDLARLTTIARSRTEPARRVERARILLATVTSRRFSRLAGLWGCTIRPCSAAWHGRWPVALWPRSTNVRGPAKRPSSRTRPRFGW